MEVLYWKSTKSYAFLYIIKYCITASLSLVNIMSLQYTSVCTITSVSSDSVYGLYTDQTMILLYYVKPHYFRLYWTMDTCLLKLSELSDFFLYVSGQNGLSNLNVAKRIHHWQDLKLHETIQGCTFNPWKISELKEFNNFVKNWIRKYKYCTYSLVLTYKKYIIHYWI